MVIDTLRDILVELGFEPEELDLSRTLTSDLDLDPDEFVQVSLELERRLGVAVTLDPDADLTLGQVVDLVVVAQSVPH